MTLRPLGPFFVVALACTAASVAQAPGAAQPAPARPTLGYQRGEGQLLPPALRGPDDGGDDMADLTTPEYLWAFWRDSLQVPAAREALPADVLQKVVAALTAACDDADETLRWQSLWALARVARHDPAVAAQVQGRVLGKNLLGVDGRLGDVAAVALGLTARGDAKALDALAKLATDAQGGAARRAYAFYGLGLAAQESADAKVQFRVLAAVERALLRASQAPDEVRIAALHALALTRLDAAPGLPGPALVLLERAWDEPPPDAPTPLDFRAHVPVAVASLVRADVPEAEVWRERFAETATTAGVSSVARSSVLALGALCRPWDGDDSPDARYGQVLQKVAKDARDQQRRNYAWFAAGVAGGAQQRAFLCEGLSASFLVRAWPAFGLAAQAGDAEAVDDDVVAALGKAIAATQHIGARAAMATALDVARRDTTRLDAAVYLERYGEVLPGGGPSATPAGRAQKLVAALGDVTTPIVQRRSMAMALGHLGDPSPRHWSARLARAIDYRSATPTLLGRPHGVLRLP